MPGISFENASAFAHRGLCGSFVTLTKAAPRFSMFLGAVSCKRNQTARSVSFYLVNQDFGRSQSTTRNGDKEPI